MSQVTASGRTAKDNLNTSISNTYYATDLHQQSHYNANSIRSGGPLEQHWYESRSAFGCGKLPGPHGNPHLVRPKPAPVPKPPSNPERDSQAYLKGLYDFKMNEWQEKTAAAEPRCSAMWSGASVYPGPRGNPGAYEPYPPGTVVSNPRPTADGNLSVLYRNQQRVYESLAMDKQRQTDRAMTGRIFNQAFQERIAPHERDGTREFYGGLR
ncbi:unnamed protein product [Amoebophrya sp. A25]|nr:unnamed protein product [Amoebophrya sp. A25]|eukprot:GSA25T00021448001.1